MGSIYARAKKCKYVILYLHKSALSDAARALSASENCASASCSTESLET